MVKFISVEVENILTLILCRFLPVTFTFQYFVSVFLQAKVYSVFQLKARGGTQAGVILAVLFKRKMFSVKLEGNPGKCYCR